MSGQPNLISRLIPIIHTVSAVPAVTSATLHRWKQMSTARQNIFTNPTLPSINSMMPEPIYVMSAPHPKPYKKTWMLRETSIFITALPKVGGRSCLPRLNKDGSRRSPATVPSQLKIEPSRLHNGNRIPNRCGLCKMRVEKPFSI